MISLLKKYKWRPPGSWLSLKLFVFRNCYSCLLLDPLAHRIELYSNEAVSCSRLSIGGYDHKSGHVIEVFAHARAPI